MSKRMIDASVWRSENFVSLPPMARLLMMGMITTADDQGRLQASPMFMRGDFFPGDDEATIKNIQAWLEMLNANKTIILYSVEGKQYAQFVNWWKYQSLQYAMPSKFPKPDTWMDRIRYNFSRGITLTFNWTLTDGTRTANTCDESGLPLQKAEKPVNNSEKPGGNTESNQVENQVENQVGVQEKEEEEEYRGDTRTHAHENTRNEKNPSPFASPVTEQQAQSEPVTATEAEQPTADEFTWQPTNGEYMPGLPNPKRNRERERNQYRRVTQVNETIAAAGKIGVDAVTFRQMVDAYLTRIGKKKLADMENDTGEQALFEAQNTILDLCVLDRMFRTVASVGSVFDSWLENSWAWATTPSKKQFLEHASQMASGTVKNEKNPQKAARGKPTVEAEERVNFSAGALFS